MRAITPGSLPDGHRERLEPGLTATGVRACSAVAMKAAPLVAIALLTACSNLTEPQVSVRHYPSTAFHEGTRFHVFVFDPNTPRPLDERIRIARAEIAGDPDCRWKDVPAVVIAEATARQGEAWADTLLAAPLECST